MTRATIITAKSLCLVLTIACTGCMGRIHVPGQIAELHKKPFCSDVSTYPPPTWKTKTINKCDTTFAKKCETKKKRECGDVTEIRCEIHPYTECKMIMKNTTYRGNEDKEETYVPWVCEEHDITIQHEKMMPVCKNITKQNCITIWKTDDKGNPVWAGKENCEPVTWKECKLEPVLVDFVIPQTNCTRDGNIPWKDCVEVNKTRMTTSMECNVLHTTSCEPETSSKCETIDYQECFEEAIEDCRPVEINYPEQHKEHKKKCLLAEDGGSVNDQLGPASINNPPGHHGHHDHSEEHNDHHGHNEEVPKPNEEVSQPAESARSGAHPTHPSLDGFDLNAIRNGKSILPPLLKRAPITPLFNEKQLLQPKAARELVQKYCSFRRDIGLKEKLELNPKSIRTDLTDPCKLLLGGGYTLKDKRKAREFGDQFGVVTDRLMRENGVPLSPAVLQALLPTATEASTLDMRSGEGRSENKSEDKPSLQEAADARNNAVDAVQSLFKTIAILVSSTLKEETTPYTTTAFTTEAPDINPTVSESPELEYSTIPVVVLYPK